MSCFTELSLDQIGEHALRYGRYGICMKPAWGTEHGIDRVLYIRNTGPVFEALQYLFRAAKYSLDKKVSYPEDDIWMSAYVNAAVAGAVAGSPLYAILLRLYEFMQPDKSIAEHEWRIVNRLPVSFPTRDKQAMIKHALAASRTWPIHSVPLEPKDIQFFAVPAEERDEFLSHLPRRFKKAPIVTYKNNSIIKRMVMSWRYKMAAMSAQIESYVYNAVLESEKKKRSVLMSGTLPAIKTIDGIHCDFYATPQQSFVNMQYHDANGERHELNMPLLEAMKFIGWLRRAEQKTGLSWDYPERG